MLKRLLFLGFELMAMGNVVPIFTQMSSCFSYADLLQLPGP